MRDFANLQGGEWLRRQGNMAGLALAFAAVFAWLGAFNTYDLGVFPRLGYWTTIFLTLYAISTVVGLVLTRIPRWERFAPWPRMGATTLATSVPLAFVVAAASMSATGWTPNIADIAEIIFSVLVVTGAYLFVGDAIHRGAPGVPAAPAATVAQEAAELTAEERPLLTPSPVDQRFLDRLPPELGTEIVCLSVEDHYVRVHTTFGNALVLMRFTDALDGLARAAGRRVHRSWWVAEDAVETLHRTGRTAQLGLFNGLTVPVSQPYLADAIDAWASARAVTA